MNPYMDSTAPGSSPNPPPSYSSSGPSPDPSLVVHHLQPSSSDPGGGLVRTASSSSSSPPPPGLSMASRRLSGLSGLSGNPYPALTIPPSPALSLPPSCQVSVILPSPDLQPRSLCSDESFPDLECAICFSQFNNVFRCPKMLQCKHTFCLECLARINVKSAEPNAVQCPLCRSFTPLPALGLPKLATDSDVLSYLPAAMQRVYSIRFLRSKGKLQVKRATSEGQRRWGQRSLTSLRSESRSLDVGLPSPPAGGGGERSGVGGALFRLTGRPACRAFLLTSVVMMMMLLTAIIIFLSTSQTK